ncbi:MAG: 1,2-phenylacetyl-CoA epoxidase subunit PaaD [Pseudomonadota bacterium]|nr:1,2-phenylacetyl-CoA epoxidase subunit PaaD [Pseudomonadota bacterium]
MSAVSLPVVTPTRVLELLDSVTDPEIPSLSIRDLGVVRSVHVDTLGKDTHVVVTISPTYSGCPATRVIEADIRNAIERAGIGNVSVKHQLNPPWTTDWITESGKQHLREAGITPPACWASDPAANDAEIECPHCGSCNTRVLAGFGSTPCKALWHCTDCFEPFDYFKPH